LMSYVALVSGLSIIDVLCCPCLWIVSGLFIIDSHFVFLELLFKQKQPHSNSNDKKE